MTKFENAFYTIMTTRDDYSNICPPKGTKVRVVRPTDRDMAEVHIPSADKNGFLVVLWEGRRIVYSKGNLC